MELPNELPNPPLPPQVCRRDLPNWFDRYADRLWKTYPKKRDKKQSIAQLRKLVTKKNSRSVLAELLNYVRLRSRIEPDGQFWPTLDRMIRQEKFQDEIPGLGMAPNRIVDLYHKVLPQHPPCTGFSRRRLENLGSLWEKLGRSERRFGDYFEYCAGLPGLTGQVPSGWMADFGFLTNPDNFREICEGEKYRDRTAA
ncbi:hypothetical protein [Microbulbifer sp. TYP-18]|uniref:hypothetical protein n=1 Tax=Microbulbifer sp. TYP-18 TaxID=3230024 RepID=UPI0034C60988